MKILVACEESQAVTIELRKLGHEAYSCDIIPCSGGHPEWHIQQDVTPLIDGECPFFTDDGASHYQFGTWDMIIAFSPCTHLACSGAKHFEKKREDGRQRGAIEFFCKFLYADCSKIAVENPVGIISGDTYIKTHFSDLEHKYKLPVKCSQHIQPWWFGDSAQKTTCLWLKNLPLLKPTQIVGKGEMQILSSGKVMPKWYSNCGGDRAKARAKTFPGIARAMAEQWAGKA